MVHLMDKHAWYSHMQHAHRFFFSFEGTCTPTSTILKISARGTTILVNGKWDMSYCLNHIIESEQYCEVCVAFYIIVD
jgi:hypothetical protein